MIGPCDTFWHCLYHENTADKYVVRSNHGPGFWHLCWSVRMAAWVSLPWAFLEQSFMDDEADEVRAFSWWLRWFCRAVDDAVVVLITFGVVLKTFQFTAPTTVFTKMAVIGAQYEKLVHQYFTILLTFWAIVVFVYNYINFLNLKLKFKKLMY